MSNPRLFNRAVIRVSPMDEGEDVRSFLQGLLTQDMTLVANGVPLWGALLSPQGKVLFDFMICADADTPADLLLDCEAEQAEALVKRLSLYRLRKKIAVVVDQELGVFWSKDGSGNDDPRLPLLGQRWIAPTAADDVDVAADYTRHRLSLGVTEGVAELGEGTTLWLECNAAELNGVSFTKGCYIGQENTARMNWRSKVNRRLVVVPIAQADEKRQRIAYPQLGQSVEHRRVEDLVGLDLPEWLATAVDPA
jgi:hypothetical protein